MRAEDLRPNGIAGERDGRRNAAREVRDALVDMSVSLEELLPILEAARSLESTLRDTIGRLGSAPAVAAPVARVGDYVPSGSAPVAARPVVQAPTAAPVTAAESAEYLVNLDDEPVPHPSEDVHSIAVVISGPRGPVDLARVHAALDSIDGVDNLRLGRYDRTGVVVYVETARNPGDLPLQQALSSVFAEGVTGRWSSPDEYLATVGAA
jgi:hypothetical protein